MNQLDLVGKATRFRRELGEDATSSPLLYPLKTSHYFYIL